MINTKDPIYFQQTYEKTLMKQFELEQQKKDHAEKQLNAIKNENEKVEKEDLGMS